MQTLVVGASACLVALASSASAQDFNIDFGDHHGAPAADYGAAAEQAGHWNLVTSSQFLEDLAGEATGVHLDASFYTGQSWTEGNTGPARTLLDDSFYSLDGTAWQLTFSGLASGFYNIYYYAPAHSSIPTGTFTVNGVATDGLPGIHGGGLVEDVSWAKLENILVADGELILLSTSTDGFRGLSGLQLQAIPEPSTYAAFAGFLALAVVLLRRRSSGRS